MKTKIIVLYTVLCMIWGTTWIMIKMSLTEGTPPIFGVGLRFFLAGVILLVITILQKKPIPHSKKAINIYLLFTLMNFVIGYGLTYYATQFIYSNLASILWAGFPMVIVLLSHFYFKNDRLTIKKVVSITVGTIGVILILSQGQAMGGEKVFVGIAMIIAAVMIAAWPNVYLKKYISHIDTLSMNAVCQTSAGIVLLLISSIIESDQAMNWSSFNIFAMAYLTLFGTIITWMIYIWLFKHLSMTQIAYVAFPPPVIAFIIGWYFLGETLTPVSILGATMVIGGAIIVNLKR
ncbi:MAG: EamA family transporter [Candidatus Marinimicrobia bacterium]|nr:EamA family transporter [Candidatus Neomarinimicrobiota bacterium]